MSADANSSVWAWLCFWNSISMNPTTVTFSILLFLFTSIILLRRKNLHEQPPGPRGLPLLGYLPFLGTDLHRDFSRLSDTYGPIFKLWLGTRLCVVITSPTIAKQVVREQDLVFSNRDATVASLTLTYGGFDIAFADYGEYWKKMRKIFVREMMSNSSIEGCSNLRRDEVRKSIRSLYRKVGKPVVVLDFALEIVINVTMAMIWGKTIKEDQGKSRKVKFQEAVDEAIFVLGQPNVSDFFPFIARFDIQGIRKRMEKARDCLHSFFDTVIEHAAEDKTVGDEERETNSMLQILLDLQSSGHNFGNKELKAVLTDILVGGTDTTATTIEWVMTRLLYHQDVMEKVMEELTRVVGLNNTVEEFHLLEMKYLDAVIKESFRMNPALPLLVPKASRETTTLCGYTIPKGTKVFINMWGIHRDPQLWENPEEFRPERFLSKTATFDLYGNNFQFMPFGSGRRVCPGIPLAEKMAKYVLASLLHLFHWELPEGNEIEFADQFGIVLKKLNHLVAIPTPRLSNPNLYEIYG